MSKSRDMLIHMQVVELATCLRSTKPLNVDSEARLRWRSTVRKLIDWVVINSPRNREWLAQGKGKPKEKPLLDLLNLLES